MNNNISIFNEKLEESVNEWEKSGKTMATVIDADEPIITQTFKRGQTVLNPLNLDTAQKQIPQYFDRETNLLYMCSATVPTPNKPYRQIWNENFGPAPQKTKIIPRENKCR